MATLHFKVLGGTMLGLLVAATAVTILSVPRKTPPVVESRPTEPAPPAPAAAPAPAPATAPIASRSRGESEWAFFFRPGDTLTWMREGAPMGVVIRLERGHRFDDGSTGPAYVVRTPDRGEVVFDADELERRARIESVRDFRLPPPRAAETASTR
jgi:hypothetical protein